MKHFNVRKIKIDTEYSMANLHSHTFFELYFLTKGKRKVIYQNNSFVILENCFCVFPPLSLHQTQGGPYERTVVEIDKSLLSNAEIGFLENCAMNGAIQLDPTYCSICLDLLEQACSVAPENRLDELNSKYRLTLIKTLLYYLQKQSLKILDNLHPLLNLNTDPLVLDVLSFLYENYAYPITLEDICAKFYVSRTTLCHRFKKSVNCTILDYLTQLRINKALTSLLNPKNSIELISQKNGFTSSAYFRKIFKEKIGCSPCAYRKKALGKEKT